MTSPVIVNCTLADKQLAEFRFTDLGDGNWSAEVAVGTDSEVLLYQRGIPAYPDDLNVLGLILSVINRLPIEAFEGPVQTTPVIRRGEISGSTC